MRAAGPHNNLVLTPTWTSPLPGPHTCLDLTPTCSQSHLFSEPPIQLDYLTCTLNKRDSVILLPYPTVP
ncbi:unnamed protein product [Gadus morhua 'NCC']